MASAKSSVNVQPWSQVERQTIRTYAQQNSSSTQRTMVRIRSSATSSPGYTACSSIICILKDCFSSHFKVTPRPIRLSYKVHSSVEKKYRDSWEWTQASAQGYWSFRSFRSVPFLALMCLRYLNTCLVVLVPPRRLYYLLQIFSRHKHILVISICPPVPRICL